ncbi:MAG: class I tRNA ligase family protein, partial [bacterium]|nr:class I tRNA ligase family protein [bacterium]
EEPGWDSELGYGRPGWHIEDTSITEKFFGPQYDLHGAGADLIFPHHEAEIAQQESASGLKPFVRYWMHAGFLVNKTQKMSKSLGNFMILREALKKYSPEVLRFYFLSSHYRSPLDYNEELLEQAKSSVARITEFRTNLLHRNGKGTDNHFADYVNKIIYEIEQAMDDDFDTPRVFATLFELIREINPQIENISPEVAGKLKHILNFFHIIFGIIVEREENIKKIEFESTGERSAVFNLHTSILAGIVMPGNLEKLIASREAARKNEKWKEADQLRKQIKNLGYEIEDTAYGPLIKKSP